MRLLFVLMVAFSICLSASEPWQLLDSPLITSAADAQALVVLAYRSTAAGVPDVFYDFTEKTCARVGEELVVRNFDDTYRITATGLLESWPTSAEEVVAPASEADRQRASWAVAAATCRNLPLNAHLVRITATPAGGWDIRWAIEKNHGCGIHVGPGQTGMFREFIWRAGCERACHCGFSQVSPQGAG